MARDPQAQEPETSIAAGTPPEGELSDEELGQVAGGLYSADSGLEYKKKTTYDEPPPPPPPPPT